jgi:hypothetical protein
MLARARLPSQLRPPLAATPAADAGTIPFPDRTRAGRAQRALSFPARDGRAAADLPKRYHAEPAGGDSVDPLTPIRCVCSRVLGLASNVWRFTTPREHGDSRAKRCPPPFPAIPFHGLWRQAAPRGAAQRELACYLMATAAGCPA